MKEEITKVTTYLEEFFSNKLDNEVKHKTERILDWLPILLDDEDWDYGYFEILMRKKLQRMVNYFTKSCLVSDNDIMIKQINFCIKILDRLIEDDYFPQDYKDMIRARIEKNNGNLFDNYKVTIDELGRKVYESIDNRSEEEIEQEEKIAYNAMRTSEFLVKRDQRLLYSMLEKYGKNWWD